VAAALGPQEVPIELVSPRSDVRLVAGEWAQVEWAPRAGFGELRKVEEWEAFLSIDGGAHYAIRLTPHLDRDLRRFNFRVPDAPTEDARILIRMGDEQHELALALPDRFTIAGKTQLSLPLPAERSYRRGEPALPGQAAVSTWVEGGRDGRGAREVEAAELPDLRGSEAETLAGGVPMVPAAPAPPAPHAAPTSNGIVQAVADRPLPPLHARPAPPPPLDILLQTQRQNE